VVITGMFSPTHRSRASTSLRGHAFCCCGVRLTATRRISRTPMTFGLTAPAARGTFRSVRGRTSASAPRWLAWRPASSSADYSSAQHGSKRRRPGGGCPACSSDDWSISNSASLESLHSLNRPAKPRSGRSALVTSPGGAATTDLIAASAGIPVTVIPIDAKFSGLDRSTPGFGKIMCLL
jgi:hypothetical protein